jgi:hypothetical protein
LRRLHARFTSSIVHIRTTTIAWRESRRLPYPPFLPRALLPREEMASHMTSQGFLVPHSIISNQFLLHPRVPRCHHVRTTGCDCEFLTRSSLGLALCPHPRPKSSPSCCRPLRVQACSSLSKCVSASRRRCKMGVGCSSQHANSALLAETIRLACGLCGAFVERA